MQTACHYPEPLNPFVPDAVAELDEDAEEAAAS
jgi:hypothetical protein